ncbi:MAG: 2-pyrone-4,6-dicarboxylate hydrolase, partial [Hyphomicrobiales bacterium]|nr:2-pyrone-4,6-dicarboxylate hydrolase [Hyphomicrobiales bacterium]
MSLFKEPKIDCHAHVFDPVRFPYGKDIEYKPAGQELGTPGQYAQVMKTYGVGYALLVQPNSGYGSDNGCLLDTIARDKHRLKGIAIFDLNTDVATLRDLQQQGIVGAAFNPTFHGIDYYRQSEPLIARLAELDMFLNLQCEHDQLELFVPWIEKLPIKVLIDHCGRPTPEAGFAQVGFAALMRIAKTKRVNVKLSGYSKFAQQSYPFEDAWPYARAIVDVYTPDRCMWASDWPYLRAPQRQDYGPLVELAG